MRETGHLITPHYAPLYRATFTLGYYPQQWKETETIVLKKPSKDNYHNPEAWRPIVLSKGEARALNKCIAEDISWGCEAHNILPTQHYGGRPGRRATDAVMALVTEVKNAWRKGKVATAVFLDVKGAYPSTDIEMLRHEMRLVGIPHQYTAWINRRMNGRSTRLTFDDYRSQPFQVDSGLDQGDPVSGILYSIYNAGPARNLIACYGEHSFLYINDNTILTTADDFRETHEKCKDILQRPDGPFDWATSHNCKYSLPKFQAVDLARPGANNERLAGKGKEMEIQLNGHTHRLKPQPVAKWLGLLIDEQLRWKAQIEVMGEKGEGWNNKFRRIAKTSSGVTANRMHNFYEAIAIPRMLYGAEVFAAPEIATKKGRRGRKKWRPKNSVIKKLTTTQRKAAIIITGAMRTTAADTLNIHANILPASQQIEKIFMKTAIRLGTIPNTHPLYRHITEATKHHIKHHHSPINDMIHEHRINQRKTTKIAAVRQDPKWSFKGTCIIEDTVTLIEAEKKDKAKTKVYTDGSGIDGKVGAAAVLFVDGEEVEVRRFKVGTLTRHEVYDGEGIGLVEGMAMIGNMEKVEGLATIYTDNEAAIRAIELRKPGPSHAIWDAFHTEYERAQKKHPRM